jgi:hypothetical protein
LVALVHGGSEAEKEYAAVPLSNLSVVDANKEAITKGAGVDALKALLQDGNARQRKYAMEALTRLQGTED